MNKDKTILLIGDYVAGKSTVINALVGSEMVPTSNFAKANIITLYKCGNSENVLVNRTNHSLPLKYSKKEFYDNYQMKNDDFEEISIEDYIARINDVDYAEIECTNNILNNGIRIIETPGFNDYTKSKIEMLCTTADVVVFILSAYKLFSREEIEMIESLFSYKRKKNIFFLINKINLIDSEYISEIKSYVENKLKPVFLYEDGNFNEDLYMKRVFYVNAAGAFKAKQEEDMEMLYQTGFPKFENTLLDTILFDLY